jgi:hypothetical protein
MKYTGREPGAGIMLEEDVGGGKTDVIEVCGTRLLQWQHTGVFYCPTCDQLGLMLPS